MPLVPDTQFTPSYLPLSIYPSPPHIYLYPFTPTHLPPTHLLLYLFNTFISTHLSLTNLPPSHLPYSHLSQTLYLLTHLPLHLYPLSPTNLLLPIYPLPFYPFTRPLTHLALTHYPFTSTHLPGLLTHLPLPIYHLPI